MNRFINFTLGVVAGYIGLWAAYRSATPQNLPVIAKDDSNKSNIQIPPNPEYVTVNTQTACSKIQRSKLQREQLFALASSDFAGACELLAKMPGLFPVGPTKTRILQELFEKFGFENFYQAIRSPLGLDTCLKAVSGLKLSSGQAYNILTAVEGALAVSSDPKKEISWSVLGGIVSQSAGTNSADNRKAFIKLLSKKPLKTNDVISLGNILDPILHSEIERELSNTFQKTLYRDAYYALWSKSVSGDPKKASDLRVMLDDESGNTQSRKLAASAAVALALAGKIPDSLGWVASLKDGSQRKEATKLLIDFVGTKDSIQPLLFTLENPTVASNDEMLSESLSYAQINPHRISKLGKIKLIEALSKNSKLAEILKLPSFQPLSDFLYSEGK